MADTPEGLRIATIKALRSIGDKIAVKPLQAASRRGDVGELATKAYLDINVMNTPRVRIDLGAPRKNK